MVCLTQDFFFYSLIYAPAPEITRTAENGTVTENGTSVENGTEEFLEIVPKNYPEITNKNLARTRESRSVFYSQNSPHIVDQPKSTNGNDHAEEGEKADSKRAMENPRRVRSSTSGIIPINQRLQKSTSHSALPSKKPAGLVIAANRGTTIGGNSSTPRVLRMPTENAEIVLNERVGKGK